MSIRARQAGCRQRAANVRRQPPDSGRNAAASSAHFLSECRNSTVTPSSFSLSIYT
jgi:hypothetical protein